MAVRFSRSHRRLPREGGVTIVIVAASLVALLGVAALAIDLVNLYVARSETQRAADAAALLGAKALVDYGVTSGDATLQAAAQAYATTLATAAAQQNLIAGQAVPAGGVTVQFPNKGTSSFAVNPQIRVTVQRTGLPSFLARVWSAASNSATATALAEAYNPSNASSVSAGGPLPVAARCVKPWLLPNLDPVHGGPFFDQTTGAIQNRGLYPGGVIGEQIRLQTACNGPQCTTWNAPSITGSFAACPPGPLAPTVSYYPAQLDATSTYQQNIETCNAKPIACGDSISIDTSVFPEQPWSTLNRDGIMNFIGATSAACNAGQDRISVTTSPFQMMAEDSNPLVTGGLVADGAVVSTSPSVVTVPVYDSGPLGNFSPSSSPQVIGFIQAFVTMVSNGGRPRLTILNVAGCGTMATAATATPVAGGGGSPVPVRLIR
jgi:hypothetical protein